MKKKQLSQILQGTTCDFIEYEINLGGIIFRFIDTVGLRETTDTIEKTGVESAQKQMKKASLIIYMIDMAKNNYRIEFEEQVNSHLCIFKKICSHLDYICGLPDMLEYQ